MKYSYNWLKKLSGTKKSPQQLADLLTMRAFEVDEIEKKKSDYYIDIDVLANRGHDALSHVGMAREISALENRKLKYEFAKLPKIKGNRLKVEISAQGRSASGGKDKDLCPRYIGVLMEDIEIKQSPQWMKDILESYDINSINNVVDATNYVMLELGQPLHAFDFDRISGDGIIVRRAKNKEQIKLLDGDEKELSNDDLVITDKDKALAIAGIKGGDHAGITNSTKTIALEAASFDAVSIRKSRTRLEIKTDASDRFEKGLDPNLAELAMSRLVEILKESGGNVVDVADVYPNKILPWKIELRFDYVSKLLGEQISEEMVIKILNSLGLQTTKHELYADVAIPTFRIDLQTQEDLIEEIGRIYGYENIKPQTPLVPIQSAKINEERLFERNVKNVLGGSGFSEVYNYSFYGKDTARHAQLGSFPHLELENPMNPDQTLLRASMIPNILKNIKENLKNFDSLKIFEIGRTYWPVRSDKDVLPIEKKMLAGAIVIDEKKKARSTSLGAGKKAEGFYEAKGDIDSLLFQVGILDQYYDNFEASPDNTFTNIWHGGRSAEIKIKGSGEEIGYLGEISPFILSEFDISKRVVMFEIDMQKLQEVSLAEREYEPIRKHPEVTRDISMIAKDNVRVDDILKVIQKSGGDLVLDVDLFDIFDFDDGTSSYAFHLIFGSDHTLESGEVDGLMEKITSNLEEDLGLKVRK